MKLKTRRILAYAELIAMLGAITALVALNLREPHGLFGLTRFGVGAFLTALIFAPLCHASWKRLQKVRVQITQLGPEGIASTDIWVAPRAAGMIGAMILVAALAFALAPALLSKA